MWPPLSADSDIIGARVGAASVIRSAAFAITAALGLIGAGDGAHARSVSLSGAHSTSQRSRSPLETFLARSARSRIKREAAARDAFRRSNPCPSTGKTSGDCPGYAIDHVTALEHGGADEPTNMQWRTTDAAKLRDKTE
jgi:hypothetical protein